MIINSIFYSQRIIPLNVVNLVSSTMSFPDEQKLAGKSFKELCNLAFQKVQWCGNATLGFVLNDGQSCKAGKEDFNESHTFNPTKKITKVEVIIRKYEDIIIRINFYSCEEILLKVGLFSDGDI